MFGFEFFPPKDEAMHERLRNSFSHLQVLKPDFVSVTYGANGSARERTFAATQDLMATGMTTMAHLTATDQSIAQLRETLARYHELGVRHILAIRGDSSDGPSAPWSPHPQGLRNATELVELVAESGEFCIGVAAFPDPHPATCDPDLDAQILSDKAKAGASFAITQLFFESAKYFDLVRRVRDLGCDIPIIPGIMPVTNISQVQRFADLSGAELPQWLRDDLAKVANDPKAVRAVGSATATRLCQELLLGGAPGLHFFTQNRSVATREIFASLLESRLLDRP